MKIDFFKQLHKKLDTKKTGGKIKRVLMGKNSTSNYKVVQSIYPDGSYTMFTYDKNSNLIKTIKRSEVTLTKNKDKTYFITTQNNEKLKKVYTAPAAKRLGWEKLLPFVKDKFQSLISVI